MPWASSRRSAIAAAHGGDPLVEVVAAGRLLAPRALQLDQCLHEALLRPVMQVARQAPSLTVGGRDQPRAGRLHLGEARLLGRPHPQRLLGLQFHGDVAERDDRAAPAVNGDRRRGVCDGHERAVAPHEPVALDTYRLPGPARQQQRALRLGERTAVRALVVNRAVTRPADQLARIVVAEQRDGGGIGEADHAGLVDEVQRVGRAGHERLEHGGHLGPLGCGVGHRATAAGRRPSARGRRAPRRACWRARQARAPRRGAPAAARYRPRARSGRPRRRAR